jgi:hypothetical protein
LRSGSGVAGVADARILAAYQAMAGANPPIPITPAKLATRAVTGYPTALRWLKIHHPELLVSKPDEASVAPVVAPEPKPAPETVVQKQPDPAPKKRGTVKANAKNLLPKPLRNPKTYPELLADDRAKTALKPSDPAQGDHDTAKAQKRAGAHTRQAGVVFRRPHGFFKPGKTRCLERAGIFDRLRHGPRTVGVECEPYRFTASGARCGHRVQADLVQLDVAKPLRQGAFNCRCDQHFALAMPSRWRSSIMSMPRFRIRTAAPLRSSA